MYHQFDAGLSDKFNFQIGTFWPQVDFSAQVDGSHPSEEIDFDEAFNLSNNQATGAIDLRWRFGKKWSAWGQVWAVDNSGKATLDEDYEWEALVFKQGTFAKAGVELEIVRLFFGRKFDLDLSNSPVTIMISAPQTSAQYSAFSIYVKRPKPGEKRAWST